MDLSSYSGYEAVAVFERQDAARAVVEALQSRGIDQGRVDMESPDSHGLEDAAATGEEDREMGAEMSRSAGRGVVIGGVVGAVLGAALGAVLFGFGTWQMLVGVLGGAALGAGLGLTLGGVGRAMDMDAGKPGVEGHEDGRFIVGVRRSDGEDSDQVTEVLRKGNPVQLHQQSADGTLQRVI